MTTLCESCFPEWEVREVLTARPMQPCEQCRKWDSRWQGMSSAGRTRCHVFRKDPRRPVAALLKKEEHEG